MALFSKTKIDPWSSAFEKYGITNPYGLQRKTVTYDKPTEHKIQTVKFSDETQNPIGKGPFGSLKYPTISKTGYYDDYGDFVELNKEQIQNNKTFTTYQPTEKTVVFDPYTNKEIDLTKINSLFSKNSGYELLNQNDVSYRVKFNENGQPEFFAKAEDTGDFLTEGLLAISPILLAGLPIGSVLGSALAPGLSTVVQTGIGNALVGGTLAEIGGGNFAKGALSSGLGSAASAYINPAISEAIGGGSVGNIAANALTKGALAELQGGDFLQGAVQGAATAGLSEYQQQLRQEQFDSQMTESGLAGQTLMDSGEQTVLEPWQQTEGISQLIKELTPYQTPYVLGPNEVFAEPDIQPLPIDNSGKIAAVGAAKFLAPIALTALLAKNVQEPSSAETSSGYPIVPIPGDWKQPVYNQEFTPSAPIDFGTSALLAGTQWENPQQFQSPQEYNLSNLINTLNYQSVPFVQQQYDVPQQVSAADFMSQFQTPTVGTGEIIGNLGGKPVSIADIISGIQSQYG
jgi:hypothetical protein